MSKPRDSYRARVIEACKDTPQKVITGAEWSALNKSLRDSAWAGKHIIQHGVSGLYAMCKEGHDPPVHRYTDLSFAHAVAHAMTPDDCALHGPEFCRNLIEATRKWANSDDDRLTAPKHEILRKNLVKHKAKLRSWSPEAREKAKQRHAERTFGTRADELRAMLAELEND